MNARSGPASLMMAIAGGIVGGGAGYFVFWWLLTQGFYAPMLPGAMLGWGFGWFSARRSIPYGVACGVAGLALGFFAEWKLVSADEHLSDFIRTIPDLGAVTLIMLALGGAMAFWLGQGSDRASARQTAADDPKLGEGSRR